MSSEHTRIGTPWKGYYITAYGIAVKHGFQGTEAEWLESLKGEYTEIRYNQDTDSIQWKHEEDEDWQELMDINEIRGPVVSSTIAQAQAAQAAAETAAQTAASAKTASEGAKTAAETAKTGAEAAKAAAEAARAGAENAQDGAESARTAAQAAQAGAASAKTAAESAQAGAEAAKAGIETAQAAAEASATAAASSAAAAASSATSAAASASTANTKEAAASVSASAAAASEQAASASASAAEASKNGAAASAASAAASEQAAEGAKNTASTAASSAQASASEAGSSAGDASDSALEAQSWAVGGTNSREGEDVDNAKYWSMAAQAAAGGGVSSFKGRSGAVIPVQGDYTAAMVTADSALAQAVGAADETAAAVMAALDGKIDSAKTELQTAINAKQNKITGAASTICTSNLSVNKVLTSSGGGKIMASPIGYNDLLSLMGMSGLKIKEQLDSKCDKAISADTAEALGITQANPTVGDALNALAGKQAIPIVTTTGTSSAYEATVEGITELYPGLKITIVPHIDATGAPTFNLNNLGAKSISRNLTDENAGSGDIPTQWIILGVPLNLMYDGHTWMAVDFPQPDMGDAYGKLPVTNGGTGRGSLATDRLLYGKGTSMIGQLAAPTVDGSVLMQDTSGAPYWVAKDVFIAKYNETTFEEINAAITAGKTIFLSWDNNIGHLTYCDDNHFCFVCIYENTGGGYVIAPIWCEGGTGWSADSADAYILLTDNELGHYFGRYDSVSAANANLSTVMARGIKAQTTDLTPGTSALTAGTICLVYE